MSAKPVWEATAKNFLNKFLAPGVAVKSRYAVFNASSDWTTLEQDNPWLLSEVTMPRYRLELLIMLYSMLSQVPQTVSPDAISFAFNAF